LASLLVTGRTPVPSVRMDEGRVRLLPENRLKVIHLPSGENEPSSTALSGCVAGELLQPAAVGADGVDVAVVPLGSRDAEEDQPAVGRRVQTASPALRLQEVSWRSLEPSALIIEEKRESTETGIHHDTSCRQRGETSLRHGALLRVLSASIPGLLPRRWQPPLPLPYRTGTVGRCSSSGSSSPRGRRVSRTTSLGGPKQRATLAILLLNANRVVAVDALADQLLRGPRTRGADGETRTTSHAG
jgi:hypothetical protein